MNLIIGAFLRKSILSAMCGFAGLLNYGACDLSMENARAEVFRMCSTLAHRGPDDHGIWLDENAAAVMGFRRLAILDLSPAGHQPMVSASGRYVVVFNGEIYNHRELRKALGRRTVAMASLGDDQLSGKGGEEFRGTSDTEVLLAAVERWGLHKAVERFVGMFAFALWDRVDRTLHLCRDRLGEKPLYYGSVKNAFVFASELKAIRRFSPFAGDVERDSLTHLVRHGYIPAPLSIYRDIYKVEPGSILTVRYDANCGCQVGQTTRYWSAEDQMIAAAENPFRGSDREAVESLDALLRRTIRQEMVADVPLGAFLSGGVDSSAVVALMQAESTRAIRTFSIGFEDSGYDEARYASAVAKHLGTDHTELYLTPTECQEVIPRLSSLYDEPFGDWSQIPTFLVASLARQHVTVSLSGDGGDELFCGYNRYVQIKRLWDKVTRVPALVRNAVGGLLRTLHKLSPREETVLGRKLLVGAQTISPDSFEHAYRVLISRWKSPTSVIIGASETDESPFTCPDQMEDWDLRRRLMLFDMVTYLPGDILTKVDRATMGVSLESRAPFLDHRIVEFAMSLPMSMLHRDNATKWLLRQVLYQYVPKSLIERPKRGFGFPVGEWIKAPLRSWAESLLDKRRLMNEGFFEPTLIRRKWKEHLAGKRNWGPALWAVLMFQAWLDTCSSEDQSVRQAA